MRDLPQPPTLLPGGRLPGKILVVESVYHQRPDSQPVSIETRYSRWTGTSDGPYRDEVTATAEWVAVQHGRLKGVGLLVVENAAGCDLQVVPTIEQRIFIDGLVVEVSIAGDDEQPKPRITVLPGENVRFGLCPGQKVFVRCLSGDAPCVITTFPA